MTLILAAPVGRADEAGKALADLEKPLDESLDKALAFLATRQQPDGSFESRFKQDTAVTSLCVMAFLSKGHTPGDGPYGAVINKGIDVVLATQDAQGLLVPPAHDNGRMYYHTIATLMLSEVSGQVDQARQAKIDAVLPKAMKIILAAQQVPKGALFQGGWRYEPASADSDLSCSGWALMSLRSARNNGAGIPKQAIDNAIKFVLNCRMPDGGFAYQPHGGSGLARTGVGLLSLELSGHHREEAAIGAGDWVLKNLPKTFGEGFFYYGLYYCSQGMFQLGGAHWDNYAAAIYPMMLKFQQPDGSWPQGSASEAPQGLCYSTAMSVLSLSVSYRQLPIYQR